MFINKIYNVTKEKLVFLTDNIWISIYRIALLAIIIAVLNVYISLVTTDIVAESSISIFEFVSSVLLIPVILAEILEAKKVSILIINYLFLNKNLKKLIRF